MYLAISISLAALLAAASLASYVATRREKTQLHFLLIGLLGALMCWTAGSVVRFSVTTPEGLEAALRVIFLGLFAAPPLFLSVAACQTRWTDRLERRGARVALAVPSVAAYLALLTNDAHHLVVRELSFAAIESGGVAWGGPVFWAFLVWSYVLAGGAAMLYLAAARQMSGGVARRRGILLAIAALVPIVTSGLYVFQALPLRFDLTPASLIMSLLLISVAVFRYQLLESLPLARRDVIEQLQDGVVIASSSGIILDMNPAALRVFRVEATALRATTLVAALAGFVAQADRAAVTDAVEGLSPARGPLRFDVATPDGRDVELSLACVGRDSDEQAGAFAVLRDVTERRRFERDARQSQKFQTVGTLISGVAHEVNNPLAFVRANLSEMHRLGELVESVGDDGSPIKLAEELTDLRSIAEETLDGIARIERIVTDMRRLGSPRDRRISAIDANDVARDALRLSNLARDSDVAVREQYADDLPTVEGTAEPLVQVVLNLLMNARHAVKGAGTLWLETAATADFVEIVVRDDGPGVPAAARERLFDPFFTTKDPDEGTGLGLTIALDIVRDHGGAIEHRQPPNGGCSFAIRLPIAV